MNLFLRLHQQTLRFDGLIEQWGGAILGLGLRAFVGWQFFKSGLVKINDWQATLSLFQEEYMVPLIPNELAAYCGAAGELILPAFLVIGLFSRPAALGLFVVNLMAVISYPQLWSFECPAGLNDHMYWGIILMVLTVNGVGKFSLDAYLKSIAK
jgi:putative oxidoreductase